MTALLLAAASHDGAVVPLTHALYGCLRHRPLQVICELLAPHFQQYYEAGDDSVLPPLRLAEAAQLQVGGRAKILRSAVLVPQRVAALQLAQHTAQCYQQLWVASLLMR